MLAADTDSCQLTRSTIASASSAGAASSGRYLPWDGATLQVAADWQIVCAAADMIFPAARDWLKDTMHAAVISPAHRSPSSSAASRKLSLFSPRRNDESADEDAVGGAGSALCLRRRPSARVTASGEAAVAAGGFRDTHRRRPTPT